MPSTADHHPGRPQLSVIIATHNAADTLGAQLDALLDQACPVDHEIVVVDNGSTDSLTPLIEGYRQHCSHLRMVDAGAGIGAGYARNLGVAATTSPWIAFCDADDVVGPSWLGAVCAGLGEHRLVSGPLELELLNPSWLAGSRGRSLTTGITYFEDIFPVASSCNLAVHRSPLEHVGGFDESFLIGQDTELSLRLWKAGIGLHFDPLCVVHYRYRSTLGGVFSQSRRFGAAHPILLDRLRRDGVKVPGATRSARRWFWLLRSLPILRSRAGRARWVYVSGQLVGRVQGSLAVIRARRQRT